MKAVKGFITLLAIGAFGNVFAADSFDTHCANIALLQDRSVQAEVKITAQQKAQMNKFADQNRAELDAYQKRLAGKHPDMHVVEGYMNEIKTKILAIMSDSQIKRLRELNLQAAGLMGILDPVVSTRIGMPNNVYKSFEKTYEDGKVKAEGILRAVLIPIDQKYSKLAKPYESKPNSPEIQKLKKDYIAEVQSARQKLQPQVNLITKETQTKMVAMITPGEKTIWLALQGKKFVPPKK